MMLSAALHFCMASRIVSAVFAGLPRVRQHQLVYGALKGKMGGELHALALETSAPSGGEG